jgi:bifunctional non-homologous end joining protein LigD
MLLLRAERLAEGPDWLYEPKLDGYRALAIKSYGVAHLQSRNNKSFDSKYPAIVQALARVPDETVIDGEVVARDPDQVALIPSSHGRSRHTHSRTRGIPRPST